MLNTIIKAFANSLEPDKTLSSFASDQVQRSLSVLRELNKKINKHEEDNIFADDKFPSKLRVIIQTNKWTIPRFTISFQYQ